MRTMRIICVAITLFCTLYPAVSVSTRTRCGSKFLDGYTPGQYSVLKWFSFLGEPSNVAIAKFLAIQDRECCLPNHAVAGFTDPADASASGPNPPPGPPGFSERIVRVHLGEGKRAYQSGSDALLQWRMHEGSTWARIVRSTKKRTAFKVNMVTIVKACQGLAWCVNPCVVLYERKDIKIKIPPSSNAMGDTGGSLSFDRDTGRENPGGGLWAGRRPGEAPVWASFPPKEAAGGSVATQSAVAYATLQGHLIQGEERMRVVWFRGQGVGPVWFEVYSVSRGNRFWGSLLFPLVRSMQARFFKEQAETVRDIVQRECCN